MAQDHDSFVAFLRQRLAEAQELTAQLSHALQQVAASNSPDGQELADQVHTTGRKALQSLVQQHRAWTDLLTPTVRANV